MHVNDGERYEEGERRLSNFHYVLVFDMSVHVACTRYLVLDLFGDMIINIRYTVADNMGGEGLQGGQCKAE